MKEDILKMKNKNLAFQKHKKRYLLRSVQRNINLTEYEAELMDKKTKELGFDSYKSFLWFCIMKQIGDLYDEDEVEEWKKIFDDYESGYNGQTWKDIALKLGS